MSLCTARVAPEKAVFRPALPLHSQPEFTGEHMPKKTYSEQLKHPNWQRKRLEVLQAADFQCELCGDKDSTLHVHHKRYVKGREVWEYEASELEALCESCHEEIHATKTLLDEVIAQYPSIMWQHHLFSLLVGYGGDYVDPAFWEHAAEAQARAGEVAWFMLNLKDGEAFEVRDIVNQIGPDRFMKALRAEVLTDFPEGRSE